MGKRRLDVLLVERGLAESPEKARALAMAGAVLAEGRPVLKAGALVDDSARLEVAEPPRYVSRGGDKLEHALRVFDLDVRGLVAADLGASTGGFTDCLLQHGAARVYAVDVGRGQLDYRLRRDPRVVVMEGVNVRHLEGLPEPVDIVTADLSFISLRLVLPVARRLLAGEASTSAGRAQKVVLADPKARLKLGLHGGLGAARGSIIVLFKPQFEAKKREVPRGGVIRDPLFHATLIGRFAAWCARGGFRVRGLTASPILGASGNREFFFWLKPVLSEARPERSRRVEGPALGGACPERSRRVEGPS